MMVCIVGVNGPSQLWQCLPMDLAKKLGAGELAIGNLGRPFPMQFQIKEGKYGLLDCVNSVEHFLRFDNGLGLLFRQRTTW